MKCASKNLVYLVFDSLRFDSLKAAKTKWARKIGRLEKRYSYASWTSPSHLTYLMGLLPHRSEARTFASKAYAKELASWSKRLALKKLDFERFLPALSLPKALGESGYRTSALVSLPVLNENTALAAHFDRYRLMPSHNEFEQMISSLDFPPGEPQFYFLNVGETHYPYETRESRNERALPRLHGLHGTLKHAGDSPTARKKAPRFFTSKELASMKRRQIESVEFLDRCLEKLFDRCPDDTHVILTADHGELFGERGYFGHGPIFHEKVFEVPFLEGARP